MVTRFYILNSQTIAARLHFVCRLCEKAMAARQHTAVLCADEAMAAQLNALLWSFRAESFIPHALSDDALAAHAAVMLLIAPERAAQTNVFINLSADELPDIPHGCQRVFEVVDQSPAVLAVTRRRFKHYRARGITPETVFI